MDDGARHNKAFTETINQASAQTSAKIRADVRFQNEKERLERQEQTVNPRDQTQVRELQRKLKEFEERTNLQQSRLIFADPRVDGQNAELTRFQKGSDDREGQMLRNRALIGVSEDKKQELLTQAATEGAHRLGLPSNLQELAQKSQATRSALAAYAVTQSIATSGTVDKSQEYVISRGMIPFDTHGDVVGRSASAKF